MCVCVGGGGGGGGGGGRWVIGMCVKGVRRKCVKGEGVGRICVEGCGWEECV